ncbi:MAG: acetate--CoA ligase family protein [Thermodesulfobacteriota bacterium]
MMYSLREIMEARGIAVIGASRDPQKPGAQLLRVLKHIGFTGQVAGVNPQGGEIFETPLYRRLADVPFAVDLAVLHIRPASVPDALRECARKGVKGVVISAEGFAETGPEGKKIQEEVKSILRTSGMRGFGPNTLGLVNTANGLTTSYFANPRMLQPGAIGFIAQSGIFVGALLRYLSSLKGLNLSKGIGLGNKVDVEETEALTYLLEDDQTSIIGMYLEDVRDGRKFLQVARRGAFKKPILILKGGRTPEGAKATATHTASLAGEDAIFAGAIRQAGLLRLLSIDEFIYTLKGFLFMPLPKGERIAIVTYSGAQAIMTIDAAVEAKLRIAQFNPATKEKIAQVIATASKAQNPVDLFPDLLAHGFEKTSLEIFKALLDDQEVDGIIFISFANPETDALGPVIEFLKNRVCKPIFFSLLGAQKDIETCQDFLEENGFPCFDFPERAVRVFSRMWQYACFRGKA